MRPTDLWVEPDEVYPQSGMKDFSESSSVLMDTAMAKVYMSAGTIGLLSMNLGSLRHESPNTIT